MIPGSRRNLVKDQSFGDRDNASLVFGGMRGPGGVRQTLDLRRGYATSCPPRQVNDSNKGSNGPAGSRSGKLHSE